MAPALQRIVFVTGMSGGGKLTAVRALEDAGYFCIDNLPVPVIPKLLEILAHSNDLARLALVVDAREQRYLGETPKIIQEARARGHHVQLLYLDATDDALIRRFSETRRRHPLAPDGTVPEGINAERKLLEELRAMADEVYDTSDTTVHELKQLVQERFGDEVAKSLNVTIMSFGYRYGLPSQADVVLDARFLPNPYFENELRPKPGTDPAVSKWVLDHAVARDFLDRVRDLLLFLLPRYREEGRAYLTVAIGCTGGRHRSVALAAALVSALSLHGVRALVRHRDVERE
jgi:UPF0042 nucleotide-binding protein